MTIDWSHFTPWASLAGGILLGLASALFILVNGRILGISGILGGLLTLKPSEAGWRVAFMLGMLAAPATLSWVAPPDLLSAPRIDASYALVVIAGLLVGFGTPPGFRLHQWSRRLWAVTPVTALFGGHGQFHGCWFCHGLCDASPVLKELS
jgi:uncharacterized membrane protein YedE/YeeE